MVKKVIVLCVFLAAVVFAQNGGTTDEMIYREGKRLKAAGITTLGLGTAIMASGIVLSVSNYNDFKDGGPRNGEENARSKERGGYAAGGLITALGVGVNLMAIPIFQRRTRLLNEAKGITTNVIVKPNGISLVGAF